MGFRTRIRGGRRSEVVEREAAIDFRDAQIEGLRDALAEAQRGQAIAEARAAALEHALALRSGVSLAPRWMEQTLRQRDRAAALEPTVVIRHRIQRPHAPTEVWRRR